MKKLPKTWYVDAQQEHPLVEMFKDWYDQQAKFSHLFVFKYYGIDNGKLDCKEETEQLIGLEDWHDCVFRKEETFEKGEQVLVRDNDWRDANSWVTAIFIAEFEGKFVADWEAKVDYFDQCKKNPNELDNKIEELKKLAEEKGVKLTIICE